MTSRPQPTSNLTFDAPGASGTRKDILHIEQNTSYEGSTELQTFWHICSHKHALLVALGP